MSLRTICTGQPFVPLPIFTVPGYLASASNDGLCNCPRHHSELSFLCECRQRHLRSEAFQISGRIFPLQRTFRGCIFFIKIIKQIIRTSLKVPRLCVHLMGYNPQIKLFSLHSLPNLKPFSLTLIG